MGKKKKTLKQKRLAEMRRSHVSQASSSLLQNEKIEDSQSTLQTTTPTLSYTFTGVKATHIAPQYSLEHDLKKTLIVSVAILLFILLLSALLHNHAFVLPLVSRY